MSLQVFVNGLELVNGPIHRLNIRETTGLWDPAALVEPGTVETFEGSFRVRQTTVDYGVREITIVGSLYIASVSYADKLRALDWLQSVYAPRPSRVVVGSLELLVDFGRVQIQADELKRLTGTIRYQITGTAVPATMSSSVSAGTGYVQGLAVDTARVNEAATLATMASGVGTITVLGDAPTPAVVTIQGAASTTYYLATSATGRRVPITTDSNGVGRIDERSGFYLAPGVNRITAYNAATGTTTLTTITVMSLFGTTWRYTGNAPAGNVTLYDLGPALTTNRTGSARYFLGNTNPSAGGTNGIVTAGDDEPRIGWAWLNRRNIIVNSLNIFTGWTSTLPVRNIISASEPFGYNLEPRAVATMEDTSTASIQTNSYLIGSLGAVSYVASVYILKDSNTTRRAGFYIQTTGGLAYVMLNTSTGVGIRANNSTGTMTGVTVAVSDEGLWWRLSATWTGEAANTLYLAPAIGPTSGNDASTTTQGSAVFACPQVELGTTPSPYQATDASGIAIDHPANAAGLVLEGQSTNIVLQSQAFDTVANWTVSGVSANAAVAPDGTTSADRITASSPFQALASQTVSVSNASIYVLSAFVKAVTGTADITVQFYDAASPNTVRGTRTVTVGTNWTRIDVAGTTASTSIVVQFSSAGTTNFDIWGAQLERGSTPTSYIPTTTASVTRFADNMGVLNPHNLLYYSEPFSQGTIGTAAVNNNWRRVGWSVSTTPVAGPVPNLLNALRVTTTTTSSDTLRQVLSPAPSQDLTGKVYTFSVWLRNNSTTSTIQIAIANESITARGSSTVTLDTTWRRFSVTGTMSSTDTAVIALINGSTAINTIDVYGAQLTEGYLPGRYVRTTDTAVLPTTAIDAAWSQNGYIEADFSWPTEVQPTQLTHVYFGTAESGAIGSRYISNLNTGSNRFSGEVWSPTATARQVSFDDATLYARGYGRFRLEWTNYTLAGNRYMYVRLYADGVLRAESNFAGTAGTSWAAAIPTAFYRGRVTGTPRGESSQISNITLGVPAMPQGAVPAGI